MISIVCVLFDGREGAIPEATRNIYDASWVDKLHRGVARNLTLPFETVCLTDRPRKYEEPIREVPLCYHADGSWLALMEMFRPDIGIERAIGVGLDTIITGSLDELASYAGDLTLPSDPLLPAKVCNAVALYSGAGAARVWESWQAANQSEYKIGPWPSEMNFMRRHWNDVERTEALYPGQLAHYKVDLAPRGGKLRGERIVYFQGRPKPSDFPQLWVKAHWR